MDRAEGVAIYSKDTLLVNIDRVASEDGKGAAEMYTYYVRNVFRHRVALVDVKNDVERVWQKEYDEPIVGFYGQAKEAPDSQANKLNDDNKYLKMTTAILNNHTIVLRLQNLA